MAAFAIKLIAWRRTGERLVYWTVPGYLTTYDPDARHGRGRVEWSTDLSRAKIFQSADAAVAEVERRGAVHEARPLAERYVVEIEEVKR